MKDPFTLQSMCIPFQVIVETLENTSLLPFYFAWSINALFSCVGLFCFFPGEAEFRLFLNLKQKLYVSPGLLSPFSHVFQLSESAG